MSGQTAYVPNRTFDSYRDASPPRSAPYEADSVAPEKSLEDPIISRKGDPDPNPKMFLVKYKDPSRLPTFQAVVILTNCPFNGKIYERNKIANLRNKLNFYNLISYLMDKRGPPNRTRIHFTGGHLRLEEQKRG